MDQKIKEIFLSGEKINKDSSDTENGYTDVIIIFDNGDTYEAPFFTLTGLKEIRKLHKKTGDFLAGKYFWAERMIISKSCELKDIRRVIKHLIEEGDFSKVFKKL